MNIVEFRARNVLGIKCVEIDANGQEVVILGGKNGSGKSSVLNAIWMALAGATAVPGEPIRKGEKKAEVTVNLGDYLVTRKFTEGGTRLEVTNREGVKQQRGQELLNGLLGQLTFDPLEFARVDAKKQAETLRRLVGLDFTEADGKRRRLYEERTAVGRDVKRVEGKLASLPLISDAPAEEVSVAQLADELRKGNEINAANTQARNRFRDGCALLEQKKEELAELERRAQLLREQIIKWSAEAAERKAEIDALQDVDVSAITGHMAQAEEINRKVRQATDRKKTAEELATFQKSYESLTEQLEAIDADKAKRTAEAPFPVAGLGFDEQGVTFRGIPFEQLSTAQQTGVSFAIGAAMNPKLQVMFIRNGNDLDSASLELLRERAKAAGVQIWMERISEGGGATVYLEAGEVKAAPAIEQPEAAAVGA